MLLVCYARTAWTRLIEGTLNPKLLNTSPAAAPATPASLRLSATALVTKSGVFVKILPSFGGLFYEYCIFMVGRWGTLQTCSSVVVSGKSQDAGYKP